MKIRWKKNKTIKASNKSFPFHIIIAIFTFFISSFHSYSRDVGELDLVFEKSEIKHKEEESRKFCCCCCCFYSWLNIACQWIWGPSCFHNNANESEDDEIMTMTSEKRKEKWVKTGLDVFASCNRKTLTLSLSFTYYI